MSHIQISLLGGSSHLDRSKRYRKTCYDFGQGPGDPAEYFSFALYHQLQPDRLIILGTSGSMWDVLLESLNLPESHEELLLELIESAAADKIQQSQLDHLAPILNNFLHADVRLLLIPYGRTPKEQLEILRAMAADIPSASSVSLDVTHGLRHLPMLAQMSALYLRKAKQVHIEGMYYGALDMTRENVTPVMDLRGLLQIADWVGALHTFDKDGDYGVFSDFLDESLGSDAALLEEASFFEHTNRPQDARGKLRTFRKTLRGTSLDEATGLFADNLLERTDWVDEQGHYQRQRQLALHYLTTRDFLRASIMGFEAFLTRQVRLQGLNDPQNHDIRNRAKEQYECSHGKRSKDSYYLLRNLRNALAHGDRSVKRDEVQAALASPQKLASTLGTLFATLLPELESE